MTALVRRPRLAALAAGGLVVALVLVSAGLGLRLPGVGFLDLFGDRTNLDYQSHYLNEFIPLRAGFVDQQLGAFGRDGATTGGLAGAPGDPRPGPYPAGRRVVVLHKATNDRFADAYSVPSVPFTARTSTAGATRESGEPGSCSPVGGTVWYRYRPTRDATLLADTFGTSYATALAVFSGSSLSDLNEVGCNVDASHASRVGFPARAGTTYYFQVTGPTGGGNLLFSLELLGRTTRVSESSSGEQANGSSDSPSVSANGRYVAFGSIASNLTRNQRPCPDPKTECAQAFVRDLRTNRTEMVSVTSRGAEGNGNASFPTISADGRFVAFQSESTDLIDASTLPCPDYSSADPGLLGDYPFKLTPSSSSLCPVQIYVRDRSTGRTEMASVSTKGKPGDGTSGMPSISADGRYVAFDSFASNLGGRPLVCDHRTGELCKQVYVHDRTTGTTEIMSASRTGAWGDAASARASISGNGRFVAFGSYASNLAPGDDNNGQLDVFEHDRLTGRTEMVSVSSSGQHANSKSSPPFVGSDQYTSYDGRYVVFGSIASNLVRGDTNDMADVFVRDRVGRTTQRVSVSWSGEQQSSPCSIAGLEGPNSWAISPDGRYVAFDSPASLLVPGDTNGVADVFLRDLVHHTTARVSVSSFGVQSDATSNVPTVASGGIVAFSFKAAKSVTLPNTEADRCSLTENPAGSSEIFLHEGNATI